jgi:hypothetical protein
MIVVRLQGGLGNQLFQYATARSLAHVHTTDIAFDGRFLGGNDATSPYTPRSFELHRLGIPFTSPPLHQQIAFGMTSLPAEALVPKVLRRLQKAVMYAEQTPAFDPALFHKASANTYLKGFFQSENYFKSLRPLLQNELALHVPESNLTHQIRSTVSVSLHIRRGDYVTLPSARAFHGLCTPQYYQQALDYISNHLPDASVFVFSDDIEWAQNNLSSALPLTFVRNTGSQAAYQDLCLMHLCRHHIIANSSFSWWGAWLNPSPDKLVIAPARWFADATAQMYTHDLIPATWIQLA